MKGVFIKYFIKRAKQNIFNSLNKINNLPDRMEKMKKNHRIKSVIQFYSIL